MIELSWPFLTVPWPIGGSTIYNLAYYLPAIIKSVLGSVSLFLIFVIGDQLREFTKGDR